MPFPVWKLWKTTINYSDRKKKKIQFNHEIHFNGIPFYNKAYQKKKKNPKNGWKTLTPGEEKVNTVVYKILPETYSSIYKIINGKNSVFSMLSLITHSKGNKTKPNSQTHLPV